ncbi:hypothetical protein OAQ84_00065 [Bdellovibrionales bacterium]|nr:hypothetical protein [Bdellovibrionales bacterium]
MRTIGPLLLLVCLFLPQLALGANPAVKPFNLGIGAFQKGEFTEASKKFEEALNASPDSTSVLYNWGLSLYKEKKIGLALAAWRRARALSPSFRESHRALEHAKKETHAAAFDGEGSDWETFRNSTLVHISFHWVAGLTLLLLFLGGFYLLKYMASRKFALREETPLPKAPVMAFTVLFFGTALLLLSICKIYDQLEPRATVIVEKATVYTAPSTDDNQIFELREGVEVLPLRTEESWVQIQSLGGLSGWIQLNSIYHTSGKQLW